MENLWHVLGIFLGPLAAEEVHQKVKFSAVSRGERVAEATAVAEAGEGPAATGGAPSAVLRSLATPWPEPRDDSLRRFVNLASASYVVKEQFVREACGMCL
jgi:hypothetical protein